jgi:hypothetical protein
MSSKLRHETEPKEEPAPRPQPNGLTPALLFIFLGVIIAAAASLYHFCTTSWNAPGAYGSPGITTSSTASAACAAPVWLLYSMLKSTNGRRRKFLLPVMLLFLGSVTLIRAFSTCPTDPQNAFNVNAETPRPESMGRGLHTQVAEICCVGNSNNKHGRQPLTWQVDSGCTSHISNSRNHFIPNTLRPVRIKIETADGNFMMARERGTVKIKTRDSNGTQRNLILHDALLVPAASMNLVSVSKLLTTQHKVVFAGSSCRIKNTTNGTNVTVPMVHGMFDLTEERAPSDPTVQTCMVADSHGDITDIDLYHQRWCHPSEKYIKTANPKLKKQKLTCGCPACIQGGIQRKPFSKKPKPPTVHKKLQKVMADTCEPFPGQKSNNQNKVFFLIMDIFTRKTWIFFGKAKSEFVHRYEEWAGYIQTETGRQPELFMPDGGTEFVNAQLKNKLKQRGTRFETTSPGNPNQNPHVERMNGTITKKVNKILIHSGLPQRFWEDAARYVVEIYNAMPHSGISWKSPNWKWNRKTAAHDKTLQRARVFGCEVWYLANNSQSLRKRQPKYRKGVNLGTAETGHGYKILDLATRKIVKTRDVYFLENKFPYREPKETRSSTVVETTNYSTIVVPPCPSNPTADAPHHDDHTETNVGIRSDQQSDPPDHDISPPSDDDDRDPPTPQNTPPQSPVLEAEPDEKHVDHSDHDYISETDNATDGDGQHNYTLRQTSSRRSANAERRNPPPPPPRKEASKRGRPKMYEVLSVDDHKTVEEGTDYLVSWSTGDQTWEPEQNLTRAQEKVQEYYNNHIDLPSQSELEQLQGEKPDQPSTDEVAASAAACEDPDYSNVDLATNYRKWNRKKVQRSNLKEHFEKAEQRELDCIAKHGTWTVVQIPEHKRQDIITCRWVYDVKRDSDNNASLYKARLTAHGYKQKEGVDYNETFAAVAQMKSFRTTLAIAKLMNMRMTQIDISNAFLHGILEEEVYMRPPPGYEHMCPPGTCLRLVKGLYGLKQAGRIWNECLVESLQKIGFTPLKSDTQVMQMTKKDKNGHATKCIIGIHVDDITLTTNNETLRSEILQLLQQKFLVKDLGGISHYLGMRVTCTDKQFSINQGAYIEKMLATFDMEKCNPAPTPGRTNLQLTKDDSPVLPDDIATMAKKPYRSLVGSLIYAFIGTRPDIGACLMRTAAFCNNPGKTHWTAAKRILRYLKGAKNDSISYSGTLKKGEKLKLRIYCDSDWAQDTDDRKSISGWVVQIANGPVSWQSKKQPTVALSSCEAEFVSLCEATKEILWYTYFLDELGIEYDTPVIHTDSQSAQDWTKNAKQHQRTKHVALKYFFVRDVVREQKLKVCYVSTKENVADILTKSTASTIFKYLKPKLQGVAARAIGILGKGVHQNN